MHATIKIAKISPHSSDTKAKTRSVSDAATYLSHPLPGPSPNSPPDAMHIIERVCEYPVVSA